MFNHNISSDHSIIEEIIRKSWSVPTPDSMRKDESDWEILNDNNTNDALGRHWFKQNLIHQMPTHTSIVNYH